MKHLPRIESERLERQMKQTAAERCTEHYNDIVGLVGLLRRELREHRRKALAEPHDWGLTSDLGHVRRSLKDLLLFMILSRFKSKSEAAHFIEQYLQNSRENSTL